MIVKKINNVRLRYVMTDYIIIIKDDIDYWVSLLLLYKIKPLAP